ncbi:hypothetical protein KIL84_002637, partial [Mauremys mutica]
SGRPAAPHAPQRLSPRRLASQCEPPPDTPPSPPARQRASERPPARLRGPNARAAPPPRAGSGA